MGERVLGSFRAGANSAWRKLQSTSERKLGRAKERSKTFADHQPADAETWQARQADLIDFYGTYESLVSVLCDAAQYGPVAKLEGDYQRLRPLLQQAYAKIRRYVVAFLRYCPEDAQFGVTLWGRSADAFEALVIPVTLAEVLRADDGSMVSRIMRTREALNLYGEHLHRLALKA